MTDDEIRAAVRTKAIIVIANLVDGVLDATVADEAQAIVALITATARRISRTAHNPAVAKAGAAFAMELVGTMATDLTADLWKVNPDGE